MSGYLHSSSSPGTPDSSGKHFPTIVKILFIMLILGLGLFAPRPAHAVSSSTCTPTADFEVVADPSTLTLQAGATGVSTLTATPIDGFSQPITLVTANRPTDLTVTLSTTSLDIGAGPVMFTATVKASLTIAFGDYSFVVNATTGTTLFHETTISVRVPAPELGLTPDKEFVAIRQGSLDTVTINLQSLYGLPASTIALTEKISFGPPAPTYPTVTLSSASIMLSSGGTATSTLTIATSATAPATTPGEYSIQVNGTASPGGAFNSTKITLDVMTPSFFLLATPLTLTIPAGSIAHSTINATSILGFSGTITLAAPSVIPPLPGITAALSSTSITLTATSSTSSDLAIDVGPLVIPGSYFVLVTGMSGSISRPVEVFVTVPGPAKADFSITGSPSPLTVSQSGMPGTSAITLTSLNGLIDTVSLSIDCSPNGLTADITPASVMLTLGGTGTSTLTVSASSFTVPGNYTVTVSGVGATLVSNSTDINIIVTGPDFKLTATPSIVFLTTGGTATSTITATSKLGFSGSINLEASVFSLTSPGLTASLSKTTLNPSGSTDSAILTLTATAAGLYDVEIKGTSWPLIHKTDVGVDVTVPTPDFSLVASPATLTIADGGSSASAIGLSPVYGFTGTVTLSATGPTGITATPIPTTISGTTTSTLTISVGSTIAPGSYTIDVKGTSGTLEHHATIALTVTSTIPTPDFRISATTPVSFTSGTTGASTVSVTVINGFYAYVTLAASAPSALTATFSPTTLYPGTSTATFSSSTPGSYTVIITGTSGTLVHTTNVQVTVTAVGTPDFTITRSPATLTIQAGNSGTSRITVTPNNNFAGTVAYTVTVPPTGPTASLSTPSNSGGTLTSTLTINVASNVVAGTYTVTVQGTSGTLSHSTQVTITVTAAPSTQPASTAPTIFGLEPLLFYGIIGAIIVAVAIGGITVVIRKKSP